MKRIHDCLILWWASVSECGRLWYVRMANVWVSYYYYYYYYYYYLHLSCHSVAAILTLVQTKQIRINIHKRNNTINRVQTIQNTLNTITHSSETPTHYKTS